MKNMDQFEGDQAVLTEKVIGCFYKVANDLGFGFMEVVYPSPRMIFST